MCGPSSQQQEIEGTEQKLGNTLQGNYQTNYAAQSGILADLNSELTPIAEAGPQQQGFGYQEQAALNAAATEGVASNYAKANEALSMTHGASSLPAGAAQVQQETLASNAAKESATQQRQNTIANYQQGRSNFATATAGLNALAQTYNPNAVASAANTGQAQAYQSASQVAQAGYQEFGEIAGGVAALAGAGAKFAKGFNPTPTAPQSNDQTDQSNADSYDNAMGINYDQSPVQAVPPETTLMPNYGPPQ